MFTDQHDIDRELIAALEIVPSNGFEAGVLRRIQQDLPSRRGLAVPVWLAAAAALLIAVGVWMLGDAGNRAIPAVRVSSGPPVAETTPQPPFEPPVIRSTAPAPQKTARQARAGAGVAGAAAGSGGPEIIVPAEQLALIRRLVGDANAGRPTLPKPVADPAAEPAELVVPPLVVEPLAVTGMDPGGSLSQGPKGLR